MSTYKHMLIGLDLSEESAQVLHKAKQIAKQCDIDISLAHVVEPLAFAYGGDMPLDLSQAQAAMEEQAKLRLAKLATENDITTREQIIAVGSASSELHRIAEDHGADLIIVGSHGRHGLALLLGSTANGVLHGAKCDVLAIRV